ncbi:hypothetical protein CI238_04702 [Colletotrichum incanum]|uniref:Uncharacterized protein n=1 Tax=Colletotrichum incanum TaxID=1573173 RepID=A0A166PQB3_COLIC|nr:hypothetical protein CI238_04702 [Colletotrichum incanum]
MEPTPAIRKLANRLVDLELDNMRARSRHFPFHEYKPWSSPEGGIHISHQLGGYIFLPSDVSAPLPKEIQYLNESLSVRHNNLQSSIQSLSDHQLLALHDFLDEEVENYAPEDEPSILVGDHFSFADTRKPRCEPQSIRNGLWLKEKAQQVAEIRLSSFYASPLLASECFNVILIHLDMTGQVASQESTWPRWAGFEDFTKRIEADYASMTGLGNDGWADVKQHYLLRIDKVYQSQPTPPRKAAATLYQTWLQDLDIKKDSWVYKTEHLTELVGTNVFNRMKTEGQMEGKSVAMVKLWQIKLKKLLPDIRKLEGRVPSETPNMEITGSAFSIGLLFNEPVDFDKLAATVEQTESLEDEDKTEED